MEHIEALRVSLQRRMIVSAGIFSLFILAGAVAGFRGTTFNDETLLVLILLFLGATLILPRSTRPRKWPNAESSEVQDRLDMLRDELRAMETRALYFRVFYILTAVVLIGLFPLMGT